MGTGEGESDGAKIISPSHQSCPRTAAPVRRSRNDTVPPRVRAEGVRDYVIIRYTYNNNRRPARSPSSSLLLLFDRSLDCIGFGVLS